VNRPTLPTACERPMRVLLAQPPLTLGHEVAPPVGLCALASWLHHLGHDVRLVDLDLDVKEADYPLTSYLRIFASAVEDFAPQVVGVTSMFNNSLLAERMLRAAKQIDPEVITIAGGPHFGALGPQALGRISHLDFVVEGEGELTLGELLESVGCSRDLRAIEGLWLRAGEEPVVKPRRALLDLALVAPVWRTLPESFALSKYPATIAAGARRRAMYVEAGRGCPYACSFCATAPFWRRRYRVKPVEVLIAELRFLYEEYGYDSFLLVHDLLTVDRGYVEALSDRLLEERLPVQWMANHRLDLDLHGILPKAKSAGLWKLFFGAESGSPRIQQSIGKRLDVGAMADTVTELSGVGIESTCSFIVGFPDESAAELSRTVGLGARLKLCGAETVQFHRLRLWPPAALCGASLSTEFDLNALQLEYPFESVPVEDIEAIRADPDFFSGFFTPASSAGAPFQLAQIELFFSHAIAIVPITVCTLASLLGDGLIESFCTIIAQRGGLSRTQLGHADPDLFGGWKAIEPVLRSWISACRGHGWRRSLMKHVLEYEAKRIEFVMTSRINDEAALQEAPEQTSLIVGVDLHELLRCLREGTRLDGPALLRPILVRLAKTTDGNYLAFRTLSGVPELCPADSVGDRARHSDRHRI